MLKTAVLQSGFTRIVFAPTRSVAQVGTRVSVMRYVRLAHFRVTCSLLAVNRSGQVRFDHCCKVARVIAPASLRQSHRHYRLTSSDDAQNDPAH